MCTCAAHIPQRAKRLLKRLKYCILVCKRLNNIHLSRTSVATNAREILDGRPKLPLGHGHRELEGAAETKDTT